MNSQLCEILPLKKKKKIIILCKTRMNSDTIFKVINKINNNYCKLKGYFVFSIVNLFIIFCRENVMLLLHRDIYSQSNIYLIIYHRIMLLISSLLHVGLEKTISKILSASNFKCGILLWELCPHTSIQMSKDSI